MNKNEMAIYNRISTKCHAFVREYYPSEYKKLVTQAKEEYENGRCRRTSRLDLQKVLKPAPEGYTYNYWGDLVKSEI